MSTYTNSSETVADSNGGRPVARLRRRVAALAFACASIGGAIAVSSPAHADTSWLYNGQQATTVGQQCDAYRRTVLITPMAYPEAAYPNGQWVSARISLHDASTGRLVYRDNWSSPVIVTTIGGISASGAVTLNPTPLFNRVINLAGGRGYVAVVDFAFYRPGYGYVYTMDRPTSMPCYV